jgi:4-coumarate--CoA ligase
LGTRYPDEDAGQIPMAFVVRKPGSNITAAQVMDYVAKQVCSQMQIYGEYELSIESRFS